VEPLSPLKAKKETFQSFQKRPKRAVNPANQTICRVFSFISLFNIYKIEQKLCGAFVAQFEWSRYLFCHKKLKPFFKISAKLKKGLAI